MNIRLLSLAFLTYSISSPLMAIEYLQFAQTAFKNYQQVGAVAPFSEYTAQAMLDTVKSYVKSNIFSAKKPLKFLEVGAGSGALTKYFLQFLIKQNIPFELDLVELDESFSEILIRKFKKYPQVKVYQSNIITWDTHKKYDIIVSTLPFNCKDFSPAIVKDIVDKLENLALHGGLFLSVEYIAMGPIGYYVFWDAQEKEDYNKKHLILYGFREKHDTYTKRVLFNIPPTYVYITKIVKNQETQI